MGAYLSESPAEVCRLVWENSCFLVVLDDSALSTFLPPLLLFYLITFSLCYCLIALLPPTRAHGFRTCLDNLRCAPHGPYPSHESLQTSRNQVAAHSREWMTHVSPGTVIVGRTLLAQPCLTASWMLCSSYMHTCPHLLPKETEEKNGAFLSTDPQLQQVHRNCINATTIKMETSAFIPVCPSQCVPTALF